ncbi:unnamed protein product, partial [Polarella glacialis]
ECRSLIVADGIPDPFVGVVCVVLSVAFHPDGGLLASGSYDYTGKVFVTSPWAEVTTLQSTQVWCLPWPSTQTADCWLQSLKTRQ